MCRRGGEAFFRGKRRKTLNSWQVFFIFLYFPVFGCILALIGSGWKSVGHFHSRHFDLSGKAKVLLKRVRSRLAQAKTKLGSSRRKLASLSASVVSLCHH